MPAAVVAVAGFVGISVSTAAAASFVTAVYVGAAVGAVVGGVKAAISGDNILKGALKGAAVGAVTSGALNIVGQAAGLVGPSASSAATKTATTGVSTEIAAPSAGQTAVDTAQSGVSVGAPHQLGPVAPPDVVSPPGKGILSSVSNFIETKPNQAMMLGQSLSGTAQGLISSKTQDANLAALMERDRLNREPFISLDGVSMNRVQPTVRNFKPLPSYKYDEETGRLVKVEQ